MNGQGDIKRWRTIISKLNHEAEHNGRLVILQIDRVSGGLCGFQLKSFNDGLSKHFTPYQFNQRHKYFQFLDL